MLTRILNLLGCDIPVSLMKANEFNEGGYWESTVIHQFHERLLASAGTNWRDWQEFYPDWFRSPKASQFREEALGILASEFGNSHLFVLKDPRLCRILPFWLDVLDAAEVRPLIVTPLRNPLDVAASLARRNGFDPAFSMLLWLRYVLDGERASRGLPRVFTAYEGVKENWRTIAQDAQSKLGVVWPCRPDGVAGAVSAYVSSSLHHHRAAPEALFNDPATSEWFTETYRILSGWAKSGESPRDFATLDRVRSEFGTASPVLSQLIAAEQRTAGKVKSTVAELGQTREQLTKIEASLAGEAQRAGNFEQELAAAKAALAEKEKRVAALSGDLNAQAQAAEKARAEIAAKLQQTEAARAKEEQELTAAKAALAEKERRVAALTSDLRHQAQAAEVAQASVVDLGSRLQKAETEKANQTQRAGQAERELSAVRAALAENDKKIAALASELLLQAQAAERMAEANASELQRAGMLEQALHALRTELSGRDDHIAALAERVALHERAAHEIQIRFADVEQARTSEARRAHQLDEELRTVQGRLVEREEEIAGLAAEFEQRVLSLEEDLASEIQKTKQLQHEAGRTKSALAESERRIAALSGELSSHLQAKDKAETELAEARSRLAQTESALMQRRHEADETAKELAKAQAELKQMTDAAVQNDKIIKGLKEHVELLVGDFRDRQNQIEALDKKQREQQPLIARLRETVEEREKTIALLQGKQKEQLEETVKLSRLVLDHQQQASDESEKTKIMRQTAAQEVGRAIVALLDNRNWSFLPRRLRLKRQMALLDRVGLLDREWYLEHYHDVRESGMDPLRHYTEFGAREGREPNPKLDRIKQ